MRSTSFLLVLLLVPSGARADHVAVTEMQALGLPDERAETLRNTLGSILTSEIAKLGHDVMSTADINAMLAFEQQKDLLGCDDATCLAEIGGALGADLFVNSSVGLVGDQFTLSLSLVNIKQAKVVQRFVGNAGSEAVLASTIKRGVGVLFGESKDTSTLGALFIKTEPPGAKVLLDGNEVGLSPTTIDEVPVGDHLVVAQLGDQRAEKAVQVVPEQIQRVTLRLSTSPPVKLMVISEPPEAEVFIAGEGMGTTPLFLTSVPAGDVALEVRLEGYEPYATTLQLSYAEFEQSGHEPFRHTAQLVGIPVPLSLVGVPDGATATLDGDEIPLEHRVLPGTHTLRVVAPGYAEFSRPVNVTPATPLRMAVRMEALAGQADYLQRLESREWLFYSTAAAAGVLGATAGWAMLSAQSMRSDADDTHHRYETETDATKMDGLYNRSVSQMDGARSRGTLGMILTGATVAAAGLAVYWRLTYPEEPTYTVDATLEPAGAGGAIVVRRGF